MRITLTPEGPQASHTIGQARNQSENSPVTNVMYVQQFAMLHGHAIEERDVYQLSIEDDYPGSIQNVCGY